MDPANGPTGKISINPHGLFRKQLVQGRVDFVARHGARDQLETGHATAAAARSLCLHVVSQYRMLLDPLGDRSVGTVSRTHCFTWTRVLFGGSARFL